MHNEELAEVRRRVERELDLYHIKEDELRAAVGQKEALESKQEELNLILGYFNKLVDKKRKEVMDKVVNLVTYGIQSVFQDPEMRVEVKERLQRNQKFYTLSIIQHGVTIDNWDDASGGVRDVLQFMLRVVFLAISSNRKFLVLDEPFRGLSTDYRENLGEFIKYLSDKLGVQFLIVSHQVEIDRAADVLYEIKTVEDETRILPVAIN